MPIDNHLVSARSPVTHQLLMKKGIGTVTLAAGLTLTKKSSQWLRIDPGGASRTVTLPAFEDGLFFYILNTGSLGEDLTVSDGSTVAVVGPEEAAFFFSDGSDWYTGGVLQATGESTESESLVRVARGTILAAAVITLSATPVEMIAAPAAGLYIEAVSCRWFLDHQGVDYDAAAAGDILTAKYTNAAGAALCDGVAGDDIGGASADYHTLVMPVPEVVPVAAAAVVASIAAGEWYAAAGDGILKWEMLYRVRTLAFA